MLHAVCYIPYTMYFALYTIYYILYTIYCMLYAIYYILNIIYYKSYIIYHMIYTICYIPYVIYYSCSNNNISRKICDGYCLGHPAGKNSRNRNTRTAIYICMHIDTCVYYNVLRTSITVSLMELEVSLSIKISIPSMRVALEKDPTQM